MTENANLEHGIAHGGYAHRQLFELTNFEGRPRAWLHHKALTTGRMAKIDRLCGSRRALTWNPRALRFVTMKMKSADEWDGFLDASRAMSHEQAYKIIKEVLDDGTGATTRRRHRDW